MKLAFAGKGGVGKTSLTAWLGDYIARSGQNVWLVDADTALSLGRASGILPKDLPPPLISRRDLIEERIRGRSETMLNLNPEVGDLPEALALRLPVVGAPLHGKKAGEKRLLVMGALNAAGGGCACDANALLKALLAHLVLERGEWVLVDLEAGVEHLGRGTAMYVDGIAIVSEPSLRALETAAQISAMASELGVTRQILALNRAGGTSSLPQGAGLPQKVISLPRLPALEERQLSSASVLGLEPEAQKLVDAFCLELINAFAAFKTA